MPTVVITHPAADFPTYFADDDLARLGAAARVLAVDVRERAAFLAALAEADVLLGSWGMPRLDAELLAAAPRLRAVCYAAGSVKGFATDAAYERGLTITTAMHANAVPVAEVTVALITLANKNWFRCQDLIRAHGRAGFDACRDNFNNPSCANQTLSEPPHPGNFGSTVGLVGFGAIARLVLERLRSMDLRVLVYDPYAPAEAVRAAGGEPVADLLDLARRSAVVSVHAPDVPATAGMFNAAFFAALPDGASFINTARGRLVDEAALIAALRGGRIQAFLDVTHPEPPEAGSELYRLPTCWLTPHRAGSSAGEIRRLGRLAIDDCLAVLAGREPRYPVRRDQLATMA